MTVTVEDGKMSPSNSTGAKETEASVHWREQIAREDGVEGTALNVDVVSGATYTEGHSLPQCSSALGIMDRRSRSRPMNRCD